MLPGAASASDAHAPAGQCSTVSPFIGKSFGFPVARVASIPTAAAAIRQSASARLH